MENTKTELLERVIKMLEINQLQLNHQINASVHMAAERWLGRQTLHEIAFVVEVKVIIVLFCM